MRKFLALILGLVFSCCFFVGCGEDWWSSIILEPENQEQENEGDQGGSENEGDQGGSGDEDEPDEEDWWTDFLWYG